MYVCTMYEKGSDVKICIDARSLMLPEEPVLPENPTAQQTKMWDLRSAAVVKNEDTIKLKMLFLHDVVLLLCGPYISKTRSLTMRIMKRSNTSGIVGAY